MHTIDSKEGDSKMNILLQYTRIWQKMTFYVSTFHIIFTYHNICQELYLHFQLKLATIKDWEIFRVTRFRIVISRFVQILARNILTGPVP